MKKTIFENHQKVLIIRKAAFFGGAEVYSLNLADGLSDKNISVTIWTNNKKLTDRAERIGINCKKKWLGPLIKNKRTFFLFIAAYLPLFVYYLINILILKIKKEVAVLHLKSLNDFLLFTFIGKLLDLKVVWSVDVAFYPKNNIVLKLWFITAFRAADRVITMSEFMKRNIARLGVGSEKISLVYNGVESKDEFLPPVINNKETIKIGFIGKVSREKGVLIFLEAAKKILEKSLKAEFWIVGSADSDYFIKKYGADRIIFKGWHDDLSVIYAEIDIVVVPSLVEESFGLVAAEAMAHGKAVVVSDRGALPELVEDRKSGIIAPAGDVNALVDILHNLINNSIKIDELGKNARCRAREFFSLKNMVSKTIEVYNMK